MNWVILLYRHNGICMPTHCANASLPLKYVNEPTRMNSGNNCLINKYDPKFPLSLQLCFRGKDVIYNLYQLLEK